MTIESGVYKIKADRPPGHHVISLENGDPRGYLVVGPVKQDDDLNQQVRFSRLFPRSIYLLMLAYSGP